MRQILALAVLLLSTATVVRAQSTNASLTGRVADPSKAPIGDAKVTAVSAGTNFRHETATDGSGRYFLTNLPPGTYALEVERDGFRRVVKPDVVLHVQDAFEIDFDM